MIFNYMRDGKLARIIFSNQYESKQLHKEAKFLCLDKLVRECDNVIATFKTEYGSCCHDLISSRSELYEILEDERSPNKFLILMNADIISGEHIRTVADYSDCREIRAVCCHGKVSAYSSELFEAGKLIKCSEDPAGDLLAYIYYAHTGIML